jgi:DNA-3-methyladenine glycosylase
MSKLPRSFFLRPTLEVAPDLLGKHLVFHSPKGKLVGEINEVEVYLGEEDPASHAFRGKTARNQVMFGQGGVAYIYFTYGMYFCMNIVTEEAGKARAVLLRSVIPLEGLEIMAQNRGKNLEELRQKKNPAKEIANLTNGPGKLCQAFGLTKEHYGIDLVESAQLYLESTRQASPIFQTSPRIGIAQAKEKPWRFFY